MKRAGRLRIAPREVWTGGETLGPAVRAHIERSLGCPLRNSYGASEFLAMGWECQHGHMHLNADWVILDPWTNATGPYPGRAALRRAADQPGQYGAAPDPLCAGRPCHRARRAVHLRIALARDYRAWPPG